MKDAPRPGARRLDYIDVDELVAALRNPKRHDLDGIGSSVAEFGFMESPTLDERTGRLIAGHGRVETLQAMRDAGQDPPDGVRVSKEGVWQVPTQRGWASSSDLHADAALLAVNRLGERSGWDPLALAGVIEGLAEYDEDLIRTAGWTEAEQLDVMAALSDVDRAGPRGQIPPGEFPQVTSIDAEFCCPSCGHEWNGSPRP